MKGYSYALPLITLSIDSLAQGEWVSVHPDALPDGFYRCIVHNDSDAPFFMGFDKEPLFFCNKKDRLDIEAPINLIDHHGFGAHHLYLYVPEIQRAKGRIYISCMILNKEADRDWETEK